MNGAVVADIASKLIATESPDAMSPSVHTTGSPVPQVPIDGTTESSVAPLGRSIEATTPGPRLAVRRHREREGEVDRLAYWRRIDQ